MTVTSAALSFSANFTPAADLATSLQPSPPNIGSCRGKPITAVCGLLYPKFMQETIHASEELFTAWRHGLMKLNIERRLQGTPRHDKLYEALMPMTIERIIGGRRPHHKQSFPFSRLS